MAQLAGKTAIVSGGARGIGRATVLALAEQGAAVVVDDLGQQSDAPSPEAEALAELIRSRGGQALAVAADVSRRPEVERLVAQTLEAFGGVDILVNNAGVPLHRWMLETTDEEWERVFAVNLRGCFLCSQLIGREMVRQGRGGRIVNVSSQVATLPIRERSAYSSSKAAVEAFTRCCALELGPHNITVNCVAPGATRTTMIPEFEDERWVKTLECVIPLGRLGMPEDIANCVVFLASGAARHITGQVLHVDGGHTAGHHNLFGPPPK